MIRYMIKNNFKLMGRSWLNAFMLILCPLLVSAVLISAFSSLMARYERKDTFSCGYCFEEGSVWKNAEDAMKEAGHQAGIRFLPFSGEDPEETIRSNDLSGFVRFGSSGYTLFRTEDEKAEGMALEYFLSSFIDQATDAAMGIGTSEQKVDLSIEHPEFVAAVESSDYYGMVYILYFSWCAIACAAALLSNEKKYGIGKRFRVSNLSDTQLYLGKLIPISLVVIVDIGIAILLSTASFGVTWGNPIYVLGLLLIMIPAAVAMSLMIHNITDHIIVTVVIIFAIVWIWGFFGGSFETYMFADHPKIIKLLSPIYHCNRAMVELSSMGRSDYYLSAILYCAGIAVVCSGLSIAIMKLKRRGRA
ncbi:MAG: ABC transporter permease [Clostridiales bacterium]|nr:ABC transporter permease [Clostridiales bacterium]